MRDELKKRNIPCELRAFPDPYGAHKDVWLPYLRDELKCDEHTILVGHSSGRAVLFIYFYFCMNCIV